MTAVVTTTVAPVSEALVWRRLQDSVGFKSTALWFVLGTVVQRVQTLGSSANALSG